MRDYEAEDRKFWRRVWLFLGGTVVAFVLFMALVVVPSHDRQREACEAKGGVLVGKYSECIKKEYVL